MTRFKVTFTLIPFLLLHLYLFLYLWAITTYFSHQSLLGIVVASLGCLLLTIWQLP